MFEELERKGEIACNEQFLACNKRFLLFAPCFSFCHINVKKNPLLTTSEITVCNSFSI